MSTIRVVGIDIAKSVFQVCVWMVDGSVAWNKKISRAFIILCHVKKSLQRHHFIEATFKINRQLRQCQIPALDRHCPFFLSVH